MEGEKVFNITFTELVTQELKVRADSREEAIKVAKTIFGSHPYKLEVYEIKTMETKNGLR